MKRDVLIQCGDHEENVERILPLAMSCKKMGFNPIVLLYEKNDGLKFLAEGIDTYRLVLKQSDNWSLRIRRYFVLPWLTMDTTYKGCAIADVFLVDTLNRYELTKGRKNSLVRHIDRLTYILDDIDPGMVFIWNGYTGRVANVLRVLCASREIPAMYLERGIRPKSVFIDAKGVNGFSALHLQKSITDTTVVDELLVDQTSSASLDEVESHIPYEQRQKKVIFVPLQVERDTNILIHGDGIESMKSFVEIVMSALGQDFFVIIRPHPEEVDNIEIDLSQYENAMLTSNGDLDAWLERCDGVITVNSTVGLQALLRNRPVFSFGKSIYSDKGLDIAVDPETLRAKVETYFAHPSLDVNAIKAFYGYLLAHHTCHDAEGCGALREAYTPILRSGEASRVFNHWEVVPDEHRQQTERLYERLKGGDYASVIVTVELDDIYLDLTYRNTKVEITKAFLEEQLLLLLERLDISYGDIVISKRSESRQGALNILVTDHGLLERAEDDFALVVDPFFRVRPSMPLDKETSRKKSWF